MTVRPMKDSDIPALRAMFERSGFEYQFPDLRGDLIETVQVIVDEEDSPIMAVAAERLVQLYLLTGEMDPAAKLAGIRTLQDATAKELKKRGYTSCEAFIPPSIAKRFGRRLERSFSWVRNPWQSWTKAF